MRHLFAILLVSIICVGCTANQRAKSFGGSTTVKLPANTKLVNVTWKEANMWYLTRPMREGEKPETLTFQEESSFGMIEGKVIFEESKK